MITLQRTAADPCLSAAVAIGRTLCRDAIWDSTSTLCNWMGRSSGETTGPGGPVTPTACALGADLYGGSLGVAWFLAHLADATGNPDFRRTALAATARTLRQLDRSPPPADLALSYHSGLVGAAYALERIAALTGATALLEPIGDLLSRAAESAAAPHVLDVIGGNAGAIPALLAMARDDQWPIARQLANRLGEELLETATRQGAIWTWDPAKVAGPAIGTVPLAGLAHGNAGLGLALFELYAATGRTGYRDGGRGAFAYEDSLFDADAGNWPDLRSLGSSDPTPRQFSVAWCHGAPGIALARMRAGILDPESADCYEKSARAALATTRKALDNVLNLPRHDAALCHGAAGLSEIVLTGGQWLDDPVLMEAAKAAGRSLIGKYGSANCWPSGTATAGPNPSLMLGLAGIGMHLLRLHQPESVPPVLIVTG